MIYNTKVVSLDNYLRSNSNIWIRPELRQTDAVLELSVECDSLHIQTGWFQAPPNRVSLAWQALLTRNANMTVAVRRLGTDVHCRATVTNSGDADARGLVLALDTADADPPTTHPSINGHSPPYIPARVPIETNGQPAKGHILVFDNLLLSQEKRTGINETREFILKPDSPLHLVQLRWTLSSWDSQIERGSLIISLNVPRWVTP